MPYIKQDMRDILRKHLDLVDFAGAGELNYCITTLCQRYLDKIGVSYASLNVVVGVLECAKQELYRRIAAPYEDNKIKENGDVY